MKFTETRLPGVFLISIEPHEDERGFFARAFCKKEFEAMRLCTEYVQCNLSFNKKRGTLRGMHFQKQHPQAKLLQVVCGCVFDVAVDLRPSSPTYRQWEAVELSEENKRQVLIPRGFGHGFVTLTDHVEFLYRADNPYAPEADAGILWSDPELGVKWGVENPILSEKDKHNPLLRDAVTGFEDW